MSSDAKTTTATDSNPPSYTPDTSPPPTYDSLRDAMSGLAMGDPDETISVPMISRVHEKTIHDYNPFSRKTGKVTQSVTVRKMTRAFYLAHYAKDVEGNYVGTSNPAPDAGMVFVPGKSTPEDVMRQVKDVAFRRQEIRGQGIGPFGTPFLHGGYSGGGGDGGGMGGGGDGGGFGGM
ncbi:hypothetical protein CC86DRAFT_366311 [Ophiobolus disseminans]|uniref:Uncharacterized protein n=1 Tax=Ophiobolus disseminans TaxID=1469910 RepID=A0A6A7AHW7_9PLEO|nr:hypothetical protein CC86DRAFT_366311 [Ophiobolus disseminans]